MRRRSFRPALESLDLRITPSETVAVSPAIPVPTPPSLVGGGDSPLWNDPTDSNPTSPDDGQLWCPQIGE